MTDVMDKGQFGHCEECLDFLTTCVVCDQPFQCSKCAHYDDDLHTECVISNDLG